MSKLRKPCDCPRCRGVPTANAKWGYDEAAVPAVCCMSCKQPIGAEPYRLDTALARFGQMSFYHERCWPKKPAKRKGRKS